MCGFVSSEIFSRLLLEKTTHTQNCRVRSSNCGESGLNSRMCDGSGAWGEFLKMTVELLRGSIAKPVKAIELYKSNVTPGQKTWFIAVVE